MLRPRLPPRRHPLTYRPDVAHRRNLGNHVIRAIRSAVPLHPLPDTLPSLTKCPRLTKRGRGHCPKGQFHNSKIAGKIQTATIRCLVSRFLLRRLAVAALRCRPRQQPLLAADVESANWLMNEGCIP
jgi:hypothetical protein